MKIFSFGFRYPAHDFPPGTLIFDARELPDPASFPPLRHLNGLSPVIQGMVLALPGIQNWIDDIVAKPPKVAIAIGCFGGVHRSVSLAEELGRRFNVTPTHLDIKRREEWKNLPYGDYKPRRVKPGKWKVEAEYEPPATGRAALVKREPREDLPVHLRNRKKGNPSQTRLPQFSNQSADKLPEFASSEKAGSFDPTPRLVKVRNMLVKRAAKAQKVKS